MFFAICSLISDRLKDTYAVKACFVIWIQIVMDGSYFQPSKLIRLQVQLPLVNGAPVKDLQKEDSPNGSNVEILCLEMLELDEN